MARPDGFQSVLQVYYNSHFLTKMGRSDGFSMVFHCSCKPHKALILSLGIFFFFFLGTKEKDRYFVSSQILRLKFLIPELLNYVIHKSLILFYLALKRELISRMSYLLVF